MSALRIEFASRDDLGPFILALRMLEREYQRQNLRFPPSLREWKIVEPENTANVLMVDRREAARRLGISTSSLDRHARDLQSVKFGGRTLYRVSDLEDFVASLEPGRGGWRVRSA